MGRATHAYGRCGAQAARPDAIGRTLTLRVLRAGKTIEM
jgi:hypothetical protein